MFSFQYITTRMWCTFCFYRSNIVAAVAKVGSAKWIDGVSFLNQWGVTVSLLRNDYRDIIITQKRLSFDIVKIESVFRYPRKECFSLLIFPSRDIRWGHNSFYWKIFTIPSKLSETKIIIFAKLSPKLYRYFLDMNNFDRKHIRLGNIFVGEITMLLNS